MGLANPYTCIRWHFTFLIYPEDELVHAHCLDTDTVATGYSDAEAVKNLQDAIEMEIDHCRRKGTFDDLWRTAPSECWEKATLSLKATMMEFIGRRRANPDVENTLEMTAQSLAAATAD